MKSLEIEGKNIDEAIEKACKEFNVARDKLNIEIISDGMPGFLGLGSKKAVIRASIISFDVSLDVPLEFSSEKGSGSSLNDGADSPKTVRADRHAETGEDLALSAKTILAGILTRMNLNCEVTAEETPDTVFINIKGEGNGLLIGKRGQNLDALQYIVNKAANKSGNGRKIIIVDAEDYRKRQEESLIALAEKVSEKVKKTKKPIALSYMNAHSRRIIHMALQNNESVTTKSRGEGEYKKIVVVPIRKTNSN
ncbi:MAG: protein jag [Deltaproteobacteria bacterium]|nr:protein jag [Deltaproteobacteria bacterium]